MTLHTFNALWIDDVRLQPDDDDQWCWANARSFHEAIFKLELIEFKKVSFDHDLASFYGNKEMTGYDVAIWLADRRISGLYTPQTFMIHSANPVGRERIQSVIDNYLI